MKNFKGKYTESLNIVIFSSVSVDTEGNTLVEMTFDKKLKKAFLFIHSFIYLFT